MASFEELSGKLQQNGAERNTAEARSSSEADRARRLGAEADRLARVLKPDDGAGAQRLQSLRAQAEEARASALEQRKRVADLAVDHAGLLEEIAKHTDPRETISRLDDAVPLLMMPLRLETRFKQSDTGKPQLWLRIYPDDCWIDSFSPTLTQTEALNARTYWAAVWSANHDTAQERGAWAALVAAHGAARARWIVKAYVPVTSRTPPQPAPHVILTIMTDTLPSLAEQDALRSYWESVWRADADKAALEAAHAALIAAVQGTAPAEELAAAYPPANPAAPLPEGASRATVPVSVIFVEMPVIETKQLAWSQAARAAIMPDRFVFIGYRTPVETNPLVAVGRPVVTPLMISPDPSAPEAEQIREDADGNLIVPEPLQWLHDFDKACTVGMGMRIDLDPEAARGFSRVLVIGIRGLADAKQGQAELEALLSAQMHSGLGVSILAQGTPTNNTEEAISGQSRFGDADKSFDAISAPQFTDTASLAEKRDGQWLAEMLGVSTDLFRHTEGAAGTDRRAAQAMNTALWPATLGYWAETMMTPVFSEDAIARTRHFFERHVMAGGGIPALRIGWQPYGVLPATAQSRIGWLKGARDNAEARHLSGLNELLQAMTREFDTLSRRVSFVGKAGDPHQLLLDIVGLHPGSVEWNKRYAESLTSYFNRLKLNGLTGWVQSFLTNIQRQATRAKLTELGYSGRADPPILNLIFSGKDLALKGPVVEEGPLSEVNPIRPTTEDGRNYIAWLAEAAGTSLDALYRQDGFTGDKPPVALLYIMLRHALQLGYSDSAINLHLGAELLDVAQARAARQDDPFIHIRTADGPSESRYGLLYAPAQEITGTAGLPLHLWIAQNLAGLSQASGLRAQRAALQRLKDEPTARLERVFADHIDLCSYRLDAWALGFTDYQLCGMRDIRNGGGPAKPGIHLGGYAWLEDLRPEQRKLEPVVIADPKLAESFESTLPLFADSANQGFIHAPSTNHAITAAILRNGYISNASPANRKAFAVNLTSERVRIALDMIEGIRAGQGMADLLGYHFERGMHDRHDEAEVDHLILELRRAFPLRADRLKSTRPPEGVSIEAIEARNVIDGLAFVEHMKATGVTTYPFGKASLPATPTPQERAIIDEEAARLLNIHDAVADLAVAEGVHQAVLGNFDRVGSTYDAYARGSFPPEPDVARTPLQGRGLTHRLALHLDPAVATSATPGAPSPRTQAEPAIAAWVASLLPAAADVGCAVSYRSAATGAMDTTPVTLAQLGLEPFDWLWVVKGDPAQAMAELDDRILLHVAATLNPRPDVPVTIQYMASGGRPFSMFEIAPQLRALGALVSKARPLRPTDLALTAEASSSDDDAPQSDKTRLDKVHLAMGQLRTALVAEAATLQTPLDLLETRAAAREARQADYDAAVASGNAAAIAAATAALAAAEAQLAAARQAIVAAIDTRLLAVAAELKSAAAFGIPAAAWGGALEQRAAIYRTLLERLARRVTQWDDRLTRFAARLAEADAAIADPLADDAARMALLAAAEVEVSAQPVLPRPATPALFRTQIVTVKRPAFTAKRDALQALSLTNATGLASLLAEVEAELPLSAFDVDPLTLEAEKQAAVTLQQDLKAIVDRVVEELDTRLAAATAQFTAHTSAPTAAKRLECLEAAAKAMLGGEFKIVPRFPLGAARAAEFANAHAASTSGAPFAHLAALPEPIDFPVDHWLAGVARVREMARLWEQAGACALACGRSEPDLLAMQLPYVAGDTWMGLDFAPGAKLEAEKLLYTAHFAAGAAPGTTQCGLLIDEWTETIPGEDADTGITFHHDRPNTEAPQAMLLVTPPEFRGSWRWPDLVDALHETLDAARRRAVEPVHLEATAFAPLLPATVVATQVAQLTIAANLALNNRITLAGGD